MRPTSKTLPASLAVSLFTSSQAWASQNPVTDFSITSNPSVDWTYGYYNQPFPTGGFFPATIPVPGPVDQWETIYGNELGVQYNDSGAVQLLPDGVGTARFNPGEIGLAPGPNAELGTLRYTAPANVSGAYNLSLVLEGLDTAGATNDFVYVLENGIPIASTPVVGFGVGIPLNASFVLAPGDTIDVAAGWGNGGPAGDYVGFQSFQLAAAAVPEPASLSLLALASPMLLARRRRTKNNG